MNNSATGLSTSISNTNNNRSIEYVIKYSDATGQEEKNYLSSTYSTNLSLADNLIHHQIKTRCK
jgi:hypothetical protein